MLCDNIFIVYDIGYTLIKLIKKIPQKNKEIADKIRNDFQSKCVNKFAVFEDELDAPSLPDQFQCIVSVLGDVSKANGLGDQWAVYEPKFQKRIDAWKQCDKAGNNIEIAMYVINNFSQFLPVDYFL